MNIMLTGITGILGSQVFYELLKREDIDCFFLLIRRKGRLLPKDRLQKIFTTYAPYLSKFTYISTAFCLGNVGGVLDNNFHNKVANYRNHYEASKHATEFYLRGQVQSTGVEVQIVRPSILGGTVYNQEKYFISCFKVYYLLARFFYNNPLARSNSIRLAINSKTTLNVVPVDYAAKVIAKVFSKNIEQLSLLLID